MLHTVELLLALVWTTLGVTCYAASSTPSGAVGVASFFLGPDVPFSPHQQKTVALFALLLGCFGFIATRAEVTRQVRSLNLTANVVVVSHFLLEMRRHSMNAWEPLAIVAVIGAFIVQLGGLKVLAPSPPAASAPAASASAASVAPATKEDKED